MIVVSDPRLMLLPLVPPLSFFTNRCCGGIFGGGRRMSVGLRPGIPEGKSGSPCFTRMDACRISMRFVAFDTGTKTAVVLFGWFVFIWFGQVRFRSVSLRFCRILRILLEGKDSFNLPYQKLWMLSQVFEVKWECWQALLPLFLWAQYQLRCLIYNVWLETNASGMYVSEMFSQLCAICFAFIIYSWLSKDENKLTNITHEIGMLTRLMYFMCCEWNIGLNF